MDRRCGKWAASAAAIDLIRILFWNGCGGLEVACGEFQVVGLVVVSGPDMAMKKPPRREVLFCGRRQRLFVDAAAEFLTGLEERYALGRHTDGDAGARVATLAGGTLTHGKGAEAAEFDTAALGEGTGDFLEDRVDELFEVVGAEVRVAVGKLLDEFGLGHGIFPLSV